MNEAARLLLIAVKNHSFSNSDTPFGGTNQQSSQNQNKDDSFRKSFQSIGCI